MPLEYLVDAVCAQFSITPIELRGKSRKMELIDARRIAVHALAGAGVGPLRGGRILARDHSTFIHHRNTPLSQENAETLLDSQRAAARRWAGQVKEMADAMERRGRPRPRHLNVGYLKDGG